MFKNSTPLQILYAWSGLHFLICTSISQLVGLSQNSMTIGKGLSNLLGDTVKKLMVM